MYISYRKFLLIFFPIVAFCLFVFSFLAKHNFTNRAQIYTADQIRSELADIKNHQGSFDDLKKYFQNLAKDKGAEYAFEVLKIADIPPNTDMHLMGHAVGDILYQQKGLEGIKYCTDDFRNACSHSIVVGLFSDEGDKALPKIAKACQEAPGGPGAYTMCFHGLGHGILAAVGYDLEKAVYYCSMFGTKEHGYQEKSQCISGTIMEIVGGGGHDHEIWAKQRVRYLSLKDPLSPCDTDLIPSDSKYLCYNYITPYLFEAVGANVGNPTANDFEKAFKYCDKLPQNDMGNRDSCYGGFGKEFIGLIQGRDIRKGSVDHISDDGFWQVYGWCKLAGVKEGTAACVQHAINSLYWGGENNYDPAIKFCSIMTDDPYNQGSCLQHLIGAVRYYKKDQQYITEFCSKVPPEQKDYCLSSGQK